jgi:hypothetical protein
MQVKKAMLFKFLIVPLAAQITEKATEQERMINMCMFGNSEELIFHVDENLACFHTKMGN